jgi:hypothetical protein
MPKVAIATPEKSVPVAPPPGTGEIESWAMLSREVDPIHLTMHRLGPGASMTLTGEPSDLALFVWQGGAEAGGAKLGEKSSVVIEYGASLQVTAGASGAVIMAFHVRERGSGEPEGGNVHILPHERVPRTDALGGNEGIGGAIHADAGCPTCHVWLHENSYAMPDKETPVHSHSEDEVIFVHSGSVRLGNRLYGPGTALAIAADTKYGFFSGPGGLGFVNFRATSPTYTSGDGKTVLDEAALWRGLLGRPEYVEPVA